MIRDVNECTSKKMEVLEKTLDGMRDDWNELREEMKIMKTEMKEVKEELKKIDNMERDYRNHNLVIYGMDTNYAESKYDTIYRIIDLFPV